MDIMNYVKPELLVVSIVLYFIGNAIKHGDIIKDNYIPYVLGGIGIVLSGIWVLANEPVQTFQEVLMAVFTSIVQGVLVAGLSTYVNQLIKQANKGRCSNEDIE